MGDFKLRHPMKQERDYYCHDDRAGERTVKFKGNTRRHGRWRGGMRDPGGGGFSGGDQHFDEDVSMGGGTDMEVTRKARFIPYDSGRGHRKSKSKGGRGRDRNNANSGPNKPDGWFRVVIPYGKNYTKQFLLESITQRSENPFVPHHFHLDRDTAVFYVQGKQASSSIMRVSNTITGPNGYRIKIRTFPCSAPPLQLDENVVEKIKICMGKRFIAETNELDMSSFATDPELKSQGIFAPIDRPNVMMKVAMIIEENLPNLRVLNLSNNRLISLDGVKMISNKVKTIAALNLSKNLIRNVNELDQVKELPLEELIVEGNPMCDMFSDTPSLVSAVRHRFPKLVRLNRNDLPPQYGFELAKASTLPPSQGNFFTNETVRNIIPQFLEQYFLIYDSGDRQKLLDAYHDQALFSFTVMLPKSGSANSFNSMITESRNLLRINHFARRLKLLHQGKLSVVSFLCELPRTQHDAASFSVDVMQTFNKYINVTCSGVFKEVSADGRPINSPVKAFNRVFLIIQYGEGFCIVNEMLNISSATSEQAKVAFKVPAPTPSPSPVPPSISSLAISPDQEHQEQMVMNFAAQSRMTLPWARQCLEQNDWDYEKAAHVFQELFKANQIPKEAFVQM